MNHTKWVSIFVLSVCLVAVLMGSKPVCAADCEQWVARAVSVQGTVQVQRVGLSTWENIKLEDRFCPGDIIRILEKSRAALVLQNEAVIRLNEKTTITIKPEEKPRTLLLRLIEGAVHFFSHVPRSLKVATPFVNSTVEGTEFFVQVEESRTYFSVFRGRVRTYNDAGELLIADGQTVIASEKEAPSLITVARPRDAVGWSLYYPPIGTPDGSGTQQDLYSASQMLQTGRVTEAQNIIRGILTEDPNNSDALALNAVIALTLHKKDEARALAEKAVASDPKSSSAKQALAYVQQAFFDVEAARSTMQAAAADDPENALVWARLSELWLATGYLDNALSAAQKAAGLSPDIGRTQTVLGYAYISQVKTDEAKEAFQKAIEMDQADPLPRLGLGLALIREGDLAAGRAQIEIAASLDPGNALVRSYLGKAFYEEKKIGLDARQYAVAKELDPNDPTPYFYDAIRKQTENRPVEALQDLQKSIELNDNRAIYRSRLLLDSDLAARSSSLARIYNNLGFQQRGLVEGWNSVNTDPANFSAHRFLADSYSALPRHEIARVSELLQAQLLQPINIAPIQPALAESNLFLIMAQGPAAAGFNAFNPLFHRNQATLQATGLGGENGTWGGEGIVSGIYDQFSLSAGYTHFETDGWRENAHQDDDIANFFAQYEFSYKTSVQAEYRYRDTVRGDTQLTFFEDDFLPNLSQEDRSETIRLGFRHAFTPASIMLGNFSLQNTDPNLENLFLVDPGDLGFPPPQIESTFEYDGDKESYGGELQYLWRSAYVNVVGGVGYFNTDSEDRLFYEVTWPGEVPPLLLFGGSDQVKADIEHYNLYVYSYINRLDKVTFTLGAGADFYEEDEKSQGDRDLDENNINPKVGISWEPVANTTLRGAVFRTLMKPLVSAQTIEPTQVAGFNQFYDDPIAAETWVYGAALDQKFNQNIYGGVELVFRDLDVPAYVQPAPGEPVELVTANWDESMGRAYLYYAPHTWFSLTAEYLYEELDREIGVSYGLNDVKTHRVPLGMNFFHPIGLNIGFKATYVSQDGEFQRQDSSIVAGDDKFWLVDAAVSYRLPKRYGFITVGVKNLFDESFEYADSDINNPAILPDRSIFGKITVSLP